MMQRGARLHNYRIRATSGRRHANALSQAPPARISSTRRSPEAFRPALHTRMTQLPEVPERLAQSSTRRRRQQNIVRIDGQTLPLFESYLCHLTREAQLI